jgi:hypothetical protein
MLPTLPLEPQALLVPAADGLVGQVVGAGGGVVVLAHGKHGLAIEAADVGHQVADAVGGTDAGIGDVQHVPVSAAIPP